MLCPPQPPGKLVQSWIARHRDPASFVLHMIGIPPTIMGVLLIPVYVWLVSVPIFLFALALFVGGYVIQFSGHALDGTDPGEVILLKRKLGWSYVEMTSARESRRGVA
jgi:uncharacterized membrane protein YGL010W